MWNPFKTPPVTPLRIRLAFATAVVADALQWAIGPLGWVVGVQFIDVAAMILTSGLLGFHLVLLPTFVLELFPGISLLPTWTGCVALLVAMRKKEQRHQVSSD